MIFNKIQLELSGNELTGEDLEILVKQCPELYKLRVENNKIEKVEYLKCLNNLSKLKKLNLEGNPIASKEDYRKEIFDLISSLVSIDKKNKNDEDVESTEYGDDEEGEEEDDEFEEDEGEEGEDEEGEEFEEDEDIGEEEDEDYGDDDVSGNKGKKKKN